jgi:hemerythrin-like metal-binding protein
MSTLAWRADFEFASPRMDATHREFVQLLATLEAAARAGAPTNCRPALEALTQHTLAHFGQEERWMARLGFEPQNCHQMQHDNVMQVLNEVQRRLGAEGDALDPEILPRLVQALADWFPTHALMLDAALAETMAERGFDPDCDDDPAGGPAMAAATPPRQAEPAGGCGRCG